MGSLRLRISTCVFSFFFFSFPIQKGQGKILYVCVYTDVRLENHIEGLFHQFFRGQNFNYKLALFTVLTT